jgi:hypothetical protein
MRIDSRVGNELYIQIVLLALEDFLVFLSLLVLLYSKASYNFETVSTRVVSRFPRNQSRPFCFVFRYHIQVSNITYARPHPLQGKGQVIGDYKSVDDDSDHILSVKHEELTARYSQQEVSLLRILLSCLATRLDIGRGQELIASSL